MLVHKQGNKFQNFFRFYRGDPNLLKEDISILRPTIIVSVPRLYNKFYDGIKAKM